MVRTHEGAERIPLTVGDFDAGMPGTITLVVQALGRSTAEMRDHYHEGDSFADVVGPLGVPTASVLAGKNMVVLVGAPGRCRTDLHLEQLRAFWQANRTTARRRLGDVRSGSTRWASGPTHRSCVCTDDGSMDFAAQGLVTEALADLIRGTGPTWRRGDRADGDDGACALDPCSQSPASGWCR